MQDDETAGPTESASRTLKRLQARAFTLTWLSYASYYLTRKNFAVVKTTLLGSYGMTQFQLGVADTLYLAAYALGQFVNGALGDRFGARRMIGIGMLGTAAIAIAMGASSTGLAFIVLFGLNGFFQSTGWPNTVKAMQPWFTRRSRGMVMGIWCTNYQVGGLLATALATVLLIHVSWRAAFFVPGMWVAGVGMMILFLLVERPQDRGLPPVEPSEAAPGREAGPNRTSGLAPFLRMLRIPAIWSLGGAYFGLKLIRYSLLFWLPFYLNQALGYDRGAAGYLSTAFEAGGIVGAVLVGWASDRFVPNRRGLILAPMILVLAGALVVFQEVGSWGEGALVASLALVGFLLFGPDALISGAAAQDIGGGEAAGSAAGIINGLGSTGAVLSGIFTATISEAFGWQTLFWVFVAFAVLSSLALVPMAFRKTGG